MMNTKIITKEEQKTIIRVEDDIKVMQCVLYDNDLLYDEEDADIDRVCEALLYGAYNDNLCYIMEGIDIIKEFLQRVESFDFEDYNFFEGCIDALQKVVDKHTRK